MPTTAGIPIGSLSASPFLPSLGGGTYTPPLTPQAASLAAFRAAQTGFAIAAETQLYPGPTSVPGLMPDASGGPVIVDWLDAAGVQGQEGAAGLNPRAVMRGQPTPLSWWQRRRLRGPETSPQPVAVNLHSRPFSRGAAAYAPHYGTIPTNPIGAGIYAPYKLPVMAGPGGQYVFGAIWWNVQAVPTSILLNPTIPIETMNALIASSSVGGTILTTG